MAKLGRFPLAIRTQEAQSTVDFNVTAAELTAWTDTLPTGLLTDGVPFEVQISALLTTPGSATTLDFKAYAGTGTNANIATGAITPANSLTDSPLDICYRGTVRSSGAAGKVSPLHLRILGVSSNLTNVHKVGAEGNLDTTSALTFKLTVTHGAQTSGQTLKVEAAVLYIWA